MFKNLTLFKTPASWIPLEASLQAGQFAPCGPKQPKSIGWVPPRKEAHGALLERVGDHIIMCLRIETKSVPASVVRKLADTKAAKIEAETGRKPGKKEARALRENALLALLPQAFPKSADIFVWLDTATGLLAIDSTGTSKVDDTTTALVNAFSELSLSMVQTAVSPQAAMARWLSAESNENDDVVPGEFFIERACELRSDDEGVVNFNRHDLEIDEVREHIAQGKLPKWTAMSHAGRVGFVLTDTMQIKKIELLEGVMAGRDANEADSGFDADVALATGELRNMIAALIDALHGRRCSMSAAYIEICAEVRYWEDATINGVDDTDGTLMPLRNGECWTPVIRLADGAVMDWPHGTVADVHFKVCDQGEYWLQDERRKRIAKWGGYYVPDDFLCPGDNGHGDYIIMKINAEGIIQKWKNPEIVWACSCDEDDQYSWKRLNEKGGELTPTLTLQGKPKLTNNNLTGLRPHESKK